jgi:hypothetical protein
MSRLPVEDAKLKALKTAIVEVLEECQDLLQFKTIGCLPRLGG